MLGARGMGRNIRQNYELRVIDSEAPGLACPAALSLGKKHVLYADSDEDSQNVTFGHCPAACGSPPADMLTRQAQSWDGLEEPLSGPSSIALVFLVGLKLGNAIRTYAVAEVGVGVRRNVTLHVGPFSGFGPDPLAPSANGEESFERPHFRQRFLKFVLNPFQFSNVHGMAEDVGLTAGFGY